MSLSLRVSDQAKVDLLEIWCYIAEDNQTAADHMIERLIDAYPVLLSTPGTGRSRSELRPGIRSYSVSPYLIFYRPSVSHLEILRVLHGSRYLETLFEIENVETFRTEVD